MMLLDRLPEELLVAEGDARGIAVRLHRLGWFRIEMVAVVKQSNAATVVRRQANVGPRGVLALNVEERFACRPCFLTKLDRQLAHLGLVQERSFAAEGVLDGVSLACLYRDSSRVLHQIRLFCWDDCPDDEVRRLGDFLQKFASSSLRSLRWQAWLSRLW